MKNFAPIQTTAKSVDNKSILTHADRVWTFKDSSIDKFLVYFNR